MNKMLLAAGVALATISTAAVALVDVNASGVGSVGKGDVQLAFNWNNAAFQANHAAVTFSLVSVSGVDTTWTCDRDAGPQTQERANTTTTTTSGVVSSVARVKNQIVGYTLSGLSSSTSTEEHEGPAIGSCPTGWTAINFVETPTGSTAPTLYATFGAATVALN